MAKVLFIYYGLDVGFNTRLIVCMCVVKRLALFL